MIYNDLFLEYLSQNFGLCKFNSAKTEISTYCPFCEGNTGKRHGHLYISTTDPVYFCHRCGSKGTVPDLLKYLKSEYSLLDFLKDKECLKDPNNSKSNNGYESEDLSATNLDFYQKNRSLVKTRKNKILSRKVEYLMNRLAICKDEVCKLPGLILDLTDYFDKLVSIGYDLNYCKFLNENYVSFLTFLGNSIVHRCLSNGDSMKRYVVTKLVDKNIPSIYAFYDSKLNEKLTKVVVSEGIFDLLNVYFSQELRTKLSLDGIRIWCSVLGRSFFNSLNVMETIMILSGAPMLDLYILSDSDTIVDFYKKLSNFYFVEHLTLFYAKNSKDFGEIGSRFDEVLTVKVR